MHIWDTSGLLFETGCDRINGASLLSEKLFGRAPAELNRESALGALPNALLHYLRLQNIATFRFDQIQIFSSLAKVQKVLFEKKLKIAVFYNKGEVNSKISLSSW